MIREAPKATKCACCNNNAICEVWSVPLCNDCNGLWLRDDRFGSGVINDALGLSDVMEQFTAEAHKRYCLEATKRTRAWVSERTKRAA